ncbi:MAG: bifunctional phosphoribosylaminoimidazolecarboxamide formyltransferase/IMP cyclohydrolase [Candidatus Omnitrophica bacterium]|nr:bifunctional phosphoribosylaminoimidazolecarboxamide formyltransferase/IMP cyclohydrolase [Candidatus Omnitrophota bacterium]
MIKIKRALISVSDKSGIVDFARELGNLGIEILSTGGTSKLLRENNIRVKDVSEYTGFPEMLDGRVKTLHPRIHAGLLALRDNPGHMSQLKEHDIGLIDMVVVNLYPFEKTVQKPQVTIEEAIENIDIGGPSMLRSAAKNHMSVAVICDPGRYTQILDELKANGNSLSSQTLRQLGVEVFKLTAHYDAAIYNHLKNNLIEGKQGNRESKFDRQLNMEFIKVQDLRYGENPHQSAAFYRDAASARGLGSMKQLWGKELSFNNILDLNATVNLVKEFVLPAVVFVKHNNPCGAAENKDLLKAYRDAWGCDRLSAFGGILAINRKIDLALAKLIAKSGFLECIITPAFSLEALSILKEKKNVRLIELAHMLNDQPELDFKRVSGGLLAQDPDNQVLDGNNLKVATKEKPTKKELESLIFGWKVAKHVKSNAIVLTKGTRTVGIGAGQMSRVDSVFIAKKKSAKSCENSCLASDAFFPKEDAVIEAIKAGVRAIIQPGGSIADPDIIKVCDKHAVAMVFTGIRHFRH